jgi:hypothetical protein
MEAILNLSPQELADLRIRALNLVLARTDKTQATEDLIKEADKIVAYILKTQEAK